MPQHLPFFRLSQFAVATFFLSSVSQASAQAPLGWIHADNQSAYTLARNQFEVNLGAIAVNDTIDFINVRDDLLSGTSRLIGDSGDLNGNTFELHYGVLDSLTVFYRRQEHSLTVELGAFNSVDVADLDTELNTTAETAGVKWQFYEAGMLNPEGRRSAASFEIHGFRSSSEDFDVRINGFNLDGIAVNFSNPQTFSVADLEDDGWRAKLTYSAPIFLGSTASFWTGFAKTKSTSATTSDLTAQSVRGIFEQRFKTEDNILSFGASFRTMLSSRIPFNLNYEYLRLTDGEFDRTPEIPQPGIPSFLSAGPATESINHTLSARLSYWVTPEFHVSVTGNLFRNQFVGLLPHYNNSLSGSFSDTPYGFAGVEIGYKFR